MSLSHSHQIIDKESSLNPIKNNYNSGIDIVKFLCAIMVFIIHVPPFQGEISELEKYINWGLQHCFCRIAVPFYFVSSGFFLFRKMSLHEINVEAVKSYCFKILRFLGTWTVFSFIGGTEHLWYLGATVIAVTLLSLCFYLNIKYIYICILACLLYTIGLLGDSYYGIIAPLAEIPLFRYILKGYTIVFGTTRNGVFMGFIFVLMGATFGHHNFKIKPKTSLFALCVSIVLLFGEVFILKFHDIPIKYNMYVFLVPVVFFLFSFASTIKLQSHSLSPKLRRIGTLVYFLHILINYFVSIGINICNKYMSLELSQFHFIISLTATILCAICIEFLSHKKKFKWINWFLS